MFFKCKNCGGNTVYNPERKEMFCPYCESEKSEVRSDEGKDDLSICPNCQGEIKVEEHAASGRCPYCDTYIIYNSRVEDAYQPQKIIPFKMGKEACKKIIRDRFGKFKFAPIDFLSEARLDSIQGMYVPFWFYDFDTKAIFDGEGTKVRTYISGDRQYTETSYYSIQRDMDIQYLDIPADASEKMPDDIMDLMEPYQYDALEPFKPEYLSGFIAEKYNMTSDQYMNRARTKMNQSAQAILRQSYTGYSGVKTSRQLIDVRKEDVSYGMLPVWRYMYRYQDTIYPFYVNGQNGKIVGECPLSKKKVWVYSATLGGLLMLIMALINVIFHFL